MSRALSFHARRLVLAVLCLAQFMLILDVAVVNVALPRLQADLVIAPAELQWVSTAYTLVFGGVLLLAGRAGDLFGRRRLFLVGLLLFTAASLLCGLVQTGWQLFVARALQGLGAAIVSPVALSLLTASSPEGADRNRALAAWGAVAAGGAVAGQILGGALIHWLDWRWIFLVNVPIGLLALGVAARVLVESRPAPSARIDLGGATTLTLGLVLVVYGMTQVEARGLDRLVLAVLAAGMASLLVFVGIERSHPAPLIRLGIFRNPALRAGNAVAALNAAASGGMVFFTTLYLQHVLGFSPLAAGMAFAPVTLLILLVSSQTPRLVQSLGVRAPLIAGAVLAASGGIYLSAISVHSSVLVGVLPGLALVGLGMGLSYAPSMILASSGVDEADHGLASGLLTTAQQLGGALGLAALATLATIVTGTGATQLPPLEAQVAGYRAGYVAAAVFPLLGLGLVLLTRRARSSAPLRPESGIGAVLVDR